jgi:hypothetical protein
MDLYLKCKQSFKFQTIYNLNLLYFCEIPKNGNNSQVKSSPGTVLR